MEYTSEHGVIRVPTQQLDQVHAEVVAAQSFFDGMVAASAQEFWDRTTLTFDTPEYMDATADHQFLVHDMSEGSSVAEHLAVEVGTMIRSYASAAEIEMSIESGRKIVFGYTGEITFDPVAGTVAYRSGLGPGRAQYCRTHPVAVAFFHALTKVHWGDRDGGYLKVETPGPGDAEITQGFGPVAASDTALAIVTAPYLNAHGELVGWDLFKGLATVPTLRKTEAIAA